MKEYSTSQRLKQIMDIKKMRQVDILHAAEPYCKRFDVKLNKNDLSQYVSGKTLPGRTSLQSSASHSAFPKPGLWGMMSAWKEA